MAIAFVAGHTGQNKGALTNVATTALVPTAVGETMFAFVTFDNLTATTPIVSSLSKPGSETNNWVKIASFDTIATAAGGVRGELWCIDATVAWNQVVNAVLSATVTAKAILALRFSGVGAQTAGSSNSTGANISLSPLPGELALAFNGSENSAAGTFGGGSIGTWTQGPNLGTTGGSAVTNAWANSMYKIVTSGASILATLTDGGLIVVSFAEAATGPVIHQVSGTVAVTTDASGDATRVPIVHQVSGTVAVSTSTSGDATVSVPSVTHQVSGSVAVSTGASGDVRSIQKVAGTVPVTVGTTGTISALLKVAGIVPVATGLAGTIQAILKVAGIVPVVTTAVGDATRVPLVIPVSGTVAVTTDASGNVDVLGGAVTHQVSGTVAVSTGATGAVSSIQRVAGSAAVVTGTAGTVRALLAVAGTVPVVTGTSGDVTRVPVIHQVSGTVAVSTTATGNIDVVGGSVTHQVSGTVAVSTATTGAVRSIQAVSGVVPVVSGASGTLARRQQVSGTVSVVTDAVGTAGAQYQISGIVPVVTTTRGSPTIVGVVPTTNVYLGDIPVTLALGDIPVKLG